MHRSICPFAEDDLVEYGPFVGFRVRKSVGLGSGVRLSATKTGVGFSVGGRGARYSVHSSGRRTASVGVPGTGVRYVSQSGGGAKGKSRSKRSAAALPHPAAPPKPGILAPAYEKKFAKGISAYMRGDAEEALALFKEASSRDARDRAVSDDLFAGLLLVQLGNGAAAIPYLEKVARSPIPLPDTLMKKYGVGGGIEISITPRVKVEVEFGSMAAALVLVEIYQQVDRTQEAIGIVQQLVEIDRRPAIILSLAELLAETDASDEVVDLLAGTRNEDDLSLNLCLLQAEALANQGLPDAALEVYKEALRARKRDVVLLTEARYGRAMIYKAMGKGAQAKKDLGRVYADDPKFRDVVTQLRALD
jgi:tetratricopeptide (TPR) repeat protein